MIYYSTLTLLSNDLLPTSPKELILCSLLVFIVSVVIGIMIGEISAIMDDITKKGWEKNEDVEELLDYMISMKVDPEVQDRVQNYLGLLEKNQMSFPETFFESISARQQEVIKLNLFRESIEGLDFIDPKDEN